MATKVYTDRIFQFFFFSFKSQFFFNWFIINRESYEFPPFSKFEKKKKEKTKIRLKNKYFKYSYVIIYGGACGCKCVIACVRFHFCLFIVNLDGSKVFFILPVPTNEKTIKNRKKNLKRVQSKQNLDWTR